MIAFQPPFIVPRSMAVGTHRDAFHDVLAMGDLALSCLWGIRRFARTLFRQALATEADQNECRDSHVNRE